MIKFFKPLPTSFLGSIHNFLFGKPERISSPSDAATSTEIVHRLRSVAHNREAWLSELEQLNDEGYQPEIVFIDTGLVTHLNDKNRRDFLDLFSAVASFDGYKAGRLMVERCKYPELVIDDETFALRMQHLVLSVKSQTFSLAKIKIANILVSPSPLSIFELLVSDVSFVSFVSVGSTLQRSRASRQIGSRFRQHGHFDPSSRRDRTAA